MPPATHRATLMSATCLATVTHVPMVQPGRGAAAMSMAAASLASGLALTSPANAAVIYTVRLNNPSESVVSNGSVATPPTITDVLGQNTFLAADTVAYTLVGTAGSRTAQLTRRTGFTGTVALGSPSPTAAVTAGSGTATASVNNASLTTNPRTLTMTITPSQRGTVTGTFVVTGKSSSPGSGIGWSYAANADDKTNLVLTTTGVAPIASTSGDKTVYALPGQSASTTFTVSNTGDGNKAGTGSTFNLQMTSNTRSVAAPWTNGTLASSATGTASLTDNSAGTVLSTSSTSTVFTYTGQANRGATSTVAITSEFSNGNPNGTNKSATGTAALTTKLTGITVAPQNTTTATGTTLYALPGKTATGTLNIQNVGDGSFLSKTLDGTLTTTITAGKGVASSIATGSTNFSLADGKTGPAATTLTQTLTYTGQTRGASTAATVTASFTNGNASGNNTGQTVTTTFAAQTVAPQNTTTATGTTLYALPGKTVTGSLVIQNVGDGSLVSKTLDGTLTTTFSFSGKSMTVSAPDGNFSLADGKTGPAATTLTQTITYVGETLGLFNSATVNALFTNGNSSGDNTSQNVSTFFKAQTVAPQASVTPSFGFGAVRVGTSVSKDVTVSNVGNGNKAGADNGTTVLTNLRGTVGSLSGVVSGAGGAVNLTDGASATYTFTFAPTARDSTALGTKLSINFINGRDDANSAGNVNTSMSGIGVGPDYDATLGGKAIDNNGTVGFVSWGGAAIQTSDLLISNITTDVAASNLTDLTLTFSIIGDATKEFQLSFDGGKSYADYSTASSPITLAKSAFQGVKVQFTNKVSGGDGFAQLRVATDEGAPLGGSGAIYVYNLSAIPEPGTLAVLGAGLLGLAVSRQRRRGRAFAALTAPPQQEDPPPPTAR